MFDEKIQMILFFYEKFMEYCALLAIVILPSCPSCCKTSFNVIMNAFIQSLHSTNFIVNPANRQQSTYIANASIIDCDSRRKRSMTVPALKFIRD